MPFRFGFSQLPQVYLEMEVMKKITERETEIETEDKEDLWIFTNINKLILLVRPLRCDSLTSGNLWGDASP